MIKVYVGDAVSYYPNIGDTHYNKIYLGKNLLYYSLPTEEEDNTNIIVKLNDEWRQINEDIEYPEDDLGQPVMGSVYESFSNHNIDNSVAKMRIIFKDTPEFKLWYRSDGEECCDYLVLSKLDTELPDSPTGNSPQVDYKTQYDGSRWFEAVYKNDGGEHFIEIAYRKDVSISNEPDRGLILLPRHRNLLNSRWVVTDGYICDGSDKYEKMVKENQYDNPVEWLKTKQYQKGELLEKGSADCDWIQLSFDTPMGTPIKQIKIKEDSRGSGDSRFTFLGESPDDYPNHFSWSFCADQGGTSDVYMNNDRVCRDLADVAELIDGYYVITYPITLYLLEIEPNVPVNNIYYRDV